MLGADDESMMNMLVTPMETENTSSETRVHNIIQTNSNRQSLVSATAETQTQTTTWDVGFSAEQQVSIDIETQTYGVL